MKLQSYGLDSYTTKNGEYTFHSHSGKECKDYYRDFVSIEVFAEGKTNVFVSIPDDIFDEMIIIYQKEKGKNNENK